MSNIIINAENLKRFAKRLQKQSTELGLDLSLSQSQELLAKVLGANNFFEIHQLLTVPDKNVEDLFLDELNSILNQKPSSIRKSFMEIDYGNFVINFMGNQEESYGVYFGATHEHVEKGLRGVGISKQESFQIVQLFEKYVSHEKYEGLLLGSKIYKKIKKDQKNVVYFKNILSAHEICIDNVYYKERYTIIKQENFDKLITKKHSSGLYYDIGLGNYAGFEDFDIVDEKLSLWQKTQINQPSKIILKYYVESHFTDIPRCLAIEWWQVNQDGLIVHKKSSDG